MSECGGQARREPEDLYRRLRDLACSSPWIDPQYVLTQLPQVWEVWEVWECCLRCGRWYAAVMMGEGSDDGSRSIFRSRSGWMMYLGWEVASQ